MKKSLHALLLISAIILASCSNAQEKDSGATEAVVEAEAKKIIDSPSKPYEEYIEDAKKSEVYTRNLENVAYSQLFDADLDGNGIPEIFVTKGYESNETMVHWFVLMLMEGEWTEIYSTATDYRTMANLSFSKLTEENSSREGLILEESSYFPIQTYTDINLYTYDDENQTLIHKVSIPYIQPITIIASNIMKNYPYSNRETLVLTYKDGDLFTNEGKRAGAIILDSLNDLLKTSINDYHILDTTGYSNVVNYYIKEEPVKEDDYQGNSCTYFEDFFVCKDGDREDVSLYGISPQKKVTVDQIKKALNIELPILQYERGEETIFEAKATLADGDYVFEFSDMSDKAKLKIVYYTPKSPYTYVSN